MTDRSHAAPPLGEELSAAARSLDIPAGDVGAVVRRGGHRLRRRRRALAGLTVLALVSGSAGAAEVLGGGESELSVSSGSGLTRGDVGIMWRTVDPASGLGFASVSSTKAPLYALSTAPGQADVGVPARVVWRSDDGVEWTAMSTLAPDLYLSDLATRDERVYAVGTGPATAAAAGRRAVSPLLVGWSDNRAKTWQREPLPLDLSILSERAVNVAVVDTAVAVGRAGTVVSAVLSATLDVPAVLPSGTTAPNGWAFTASGVDLLGPDRGVACPEGTSAPEQLRSSRVAELAEGGTQLRKEPEPAEGKEAAEVMPTMCLREDRTPVEVSPQDARGVVASYTWDQLHVDGDLLRAVRRQPVAFLAPPGRDRFERVDLPEVDPVHGPVLLEAHDEGFDLVATTMGGRHRPAGPGSPGIVALHSADGRTWARSPVAGEGAGWAAAAGRVGGLSTIIGQGIDGAVMLRADGAGGWSTTPLAGAMAVDVPDDSSVLVVSAAVGPFGIVAAVVVVPEGRPESEPARAHDPPSPPEPRLLVSRDGTTWDDHSVAELAGRPVRGVIRAAVVGNRAIVAASVIPRQGDKPEQVVLLGTPS